ncbi:MAG: TIGR03032 family protein [Isosphaeraceae bacterium]
MQSTTSQCIIEAAYLDEAVTPRSGPLERSGRNNMATQRAATRPTAKPTEQNGRDRLLSTPDAPAGPTEDAGPLRAAHTPNVPAILRQLGASLLVTTYQAGKLVMVRDEGDHLNTHFRSFKAPMGLALADGGARLAIGTTIQVWEFRDNPDVARRLEPAGTHDGCYLPRASHVTGNVMIHEMAFGAGGQLWFVNTRFSCLATLDPESSFVPRWRPPFVTELEPSDRCHLNGLGMVDGRPKYVTALGETNDIGGWRANKARGGLLMDVGSGEVLCRGLSMPHSPRWYGGRLWVCESGSGTLGTVDLNTGRYEAVAAVPGFTRGLDFAGDLAFVGLSQVRESAVFSGIPITERLAPEQRTCGICVVDLRRGEPVGLLKFESGVQEVFAVALLPRRFPDLINDDEKVLESSFVVPTECLGEVAATVRAAGSV